MTNPEVFFNAVAGIASSPEAAAIRDDYLRAFLVEQILEEKADRDAEPCVYVAPAWDVPALTSRLGGLSVSDRRGLLDLFETHGRWLQMRLQQAARRLTPALARTWRSFLLVRARSKAC